MSGVLLLLRHPKVAYRSCEDCQKYAYNEETGQMMRQKYGQQLPVLRHPRDLPPCRVLSVGCPKGTPENPKSLSRKNQRAYYHYLQCKATNSWPDDGIVRENAAIIESAYQLAERLDRWEETAHRERLEKLLAAALKVRVM